MSAPLEQTKIGPLDISEWMRLDPVFEHEFQTCIPDPRFSRVIAEKHEGEIAGFVTVESQVCIGALYVYPEFRGDRGIHRRLVAYVDERCERERRSLYAMTEKPKVERLMRRFGARPVPHSLWRKDYGEG